MSNINGGKFKGKGAYGCVFQPPLKCKYAIDTKTNPKYISKLSSVTSASQEWKVNENIKGYLPNYKNYSITWKSRCTPAKYQKDKDFNKCPMAYGVQKNQSNYILLQARYGGQTLERRFDYLNKILKSKKKNKQKLWKLKYIETIRELESLFQGISEMYENDIVHNDIKDENIVRLIKDATTLDKGTRFIDFGLSGVMPDDLQKLKEKSIRSFGEARWYFVYPAEYLYCMGDTMDIKNELESGGYKQRLFYKEIRELLVRYIGVYKSYKEFDKKIEEIMKKSINGKYNSNDTLYELFMKNDCYSLAMTCLFLLEYYSSSSSKKIIKKIFKESKQGSFLGDFKLLLRKMLDLDYTQRITATEAYDEFQGIINKKYKDSSPPKKTVRKKQ